MENKIRYTFPKAERLCSRKIIEALFAGGHKSMSVYPLRVVCMAVDEADLPLMKHCSCVKDSVEGVPAIQVLISVSKRRFKHAVDRNRVKRLVREAYRRNKHLLVPAIEERGQHIALAFLWLSSDIPTADVVERRVVNLLMRVKESLTL